MNIDSLIEEICKIENPYEYDEGVWHEPLEGYLMTHETAEENAAHSAFEECRDLVLILLLTLNPPVAQWE